MLGTLSIVATPIGNLGDITIRALDVLKASDVVLCEDTRVTQHLLSHFAIQTKTVSYHQHSSSQKVHTICEFLEQGKHVALVTDAGTPGISDPGNILIFELLQKIPTLSIIPVPGVSAVVTALSISGFATDKFLFLGFPPNKNKRDKFFTELSTSPYTTAFYESSHRIKKAIDALAAVLPPERNVCIARELTKKFETLYRGTIHHLATQQIVEKGEFVVVVEGR